LTLSPNPETPNPILCSPGTRLRGTHSTPPSIW